MKAIKLVLNALELPNLSKSGWLFTVEEKKPAQVENLSGCAEAFNIRLAAR